MSEVLTNGIKVPDKGSRAWYDDMRGDLVKLDALIGSASSVTVNPILTSGIEIASITVNGTSYSLYQQDGDIAVNIKPVTTNEELPILLSKSSEENTDSVDMSVGVTVNPSTNAITATTFVGALTGNASTATSATKATQDGDGNVINTTYAKVGHTHDDRYYTETEVNNLLSGKANTSGTYSSLTVGSATKATQDASGNVITDTYATKSENALKANDSSVVHLANTETITGIKYFTEDIYNKNENIVLSETPTVDQYIRYRFVDNSNISLALIQFANRPDGTRDLAFYLKADTSTIGVVLNTDKSFYPLSNNSYSLGSTSNKWLSVYATTVNTSILNIPQNAIVLAFCSSAVNNGSTVAGTNLKVANGGTGGSFTATTETLTGTYRALNTVVANGVGMFIKIA